MSILINFIKKKAQKGNTQEKTSYHHYYGTEIMLDGYISPLVMPRNRLLELKGQESIVDFSQRCHISIEEMEFLLDNVNVEPTPTQLASISFWCNVSVLWLLGYHTTKQNSGAANNQTLLALLGRRNAIEKTLLHSNERGAWGEICRRTTRKRLESLNMEIGNLASRHIVKEHLPLSEADLSALCGQPVFVEQGENHAWGIVINDYIITMYGKQLIENNEETYYAYLTPRV